MVITPVFLGYLVAFGGAAATCLASIPRSRHIEDPDTRRGITWLLVLSGSWALTHVGFLLVPTVPLKTTFYIAGLVIGLSAVGSWLYFCSAYTGRSIHRNPIIRLTAVGVFLAIVLVKLTNPYHQLYFTTEFVSSPFPHLAVQNGLFHWLVMGLSYALAVVGYFMLLELFMQVSYDTKPFIGLVTLTGLPIVLDVIGLASPYLLDITYEPIGVAVFAVGVLFVYLGRFQTIQLAAESDDPVVVLSEENRIRDYNDSAVELFPELSNRNVIGRSLESVLPAIEDALQNQSDVIELERQDTTRYYRLTENPFGAEQAQLGQLITLADITHREQYRQELERQNERLDQFADVVSHDLRNPLNVALGRLELARTEFDSEDLDSVARALERMETLIEDVLSLARQGQPIGETEAVELASIVDRCWQVVDTAEAELVVDDDLAFLADADRLQQLLENLFRNAIEHGGSDVTIRVGALDSAPGFYVADDGPGIPAPNRDQVFESGFTTDEDGTGFGLAIVKEIAEAHGWTIGVTASDAGGARFEVAGVELSDS